MSDNSWDSYFMQIAELSATRSKDPKTQVGACIVKDKHILSIGYNGAPKGFPDNEVPINNDSEKLSEQKRTYMCHAELNAILNYKGILSDLEDSTIYITLFPCFECAKVLIQAGIKTIIYKDDYYHLDISDFSKFLLNKCGINFYKLEER